MTNAVQNLRDIEPLDELSSQQRWRKRIALERRFFKKMMRLDAAEAAIFKNHLA